MKPTKRSANDRGSGGNAPAGIQSLTRSSFFCAGRNFFFLLLCRAEIVSGGRARPAPPTVAVQPCSWYACYKRQYRQNTNIEKLYVFRNFLYFYILKLLFLSIFCRYIRYMYFVGTNDMFVGLHVPTNFPMYRQISKCTDKSPKRHYWGGNCPPPPLPSPSGYANTPCTNL